ncbi:MAG TPA: hypothetical protein ENH23_00990, partial [candidate division Zixibacteria bacterium]|nr:hypothetical protein [candidate division Zixibacteria bacterium]
MQAFVKTIVVTLFVAAFFTYFFTNFSVFTTQEDSKQPFFQIAEAKPPAGSGPVSYSSAVKAASPAVVNI